MIVSRDTKPKMTSASRSPTGRPRTVTHSDRITVSRPGFFLTLGMLQGRHLASAS